MPPPSLPLVSIKYWLRRAVHPSLGRALFDIQALCLLIRVENHAFWLILGVHVDPLILYSVYPHALSGVLARDLAHLVSSGGHQT